MTSRNEREGLDAQGISRVASEMVNVGTEKTGLSMLELAAVFRTAAEACDQAHKLNELAALSGRLRRWKPEA